MSKAGSNLIIFPKLRRSEQTGWTLKRVPVRSIGLLLMTMVGAAWALNPTSQARGEGMLSERASIDRMIFEGEPQVVAQLMGAVVGPDQTPTRELEVVGPQGNSDRRVVVSEVGQQNSTRQLTQGEFFAAVERLESELGTHGNYPAVPSEEVGVTGASYRTDGDGFELQAGEFFYSSRTGFELKEDAKENPSRYRVTGFLQSLSQGWGPWEREVQEFSPTGRDGDMDLDWLARAEPTPNWSARMYFPVGRDFAAYAFRKSDGSSAYRSGELLYDAVTGTFQMKLHHREPMEAPSYAYADLESELSSVVSGCEVVGDADFLRDLGLCTSSDESGAVHLSTPVPLPMSASRAIDGLALATFSRHARALETNAAVDALEGLSETSSVGAVGRLSLVDKLGQVHQVRLRAGRAGDYDWVVGQLCPLDSNEGAVAESTAYSDPDERYGTAKVVAGE